MRAHFGLAMCAHFGLAKPHGWVGFWVGSGSLFCFRFGGGFGFGMGPVWFRFSLNLSSLRDLAKVQLFGKQIAGREEGSDNQHG